MLKSVKYRIHTHSETNKFKERKKTKHKNKNYTIGLILLMTFSAIAVSLPLTYAHLHPGLSTRSYLTVAPNPIGLGQPTAVIFWLDMPPPTAGGAGGDRWRGITIDVTKPDGAKQTFGPIHFRPCRKRRNRIHS